MSIPLIDLLRLLERDDLPSHLADVLIAIAMKRDDQPTPHQVAREASKSFGWSEETWRDTMRPHIAQEIALARESGGGAK